MDEASNTLLHKILHENGYSITTSRKLVCDVLWNKEPQSTSELYKLLIGRIDRASMYRTLLLFEKLGLIHRVYIGWKYKIELSDVFSSHHHHISCLNCGVVKAIHEEAEIESLIDKLADRYGMTAERHQLEIQGVCQDCANI